MDDVNEKRKELLAEIFQRKPGLGEALDAARGPCKKYQAKGERGGKGCNRGEKCPYLHVRRGVDLSLATNRLRAPFLHPYPGNTLLLQPPFKEALKTWWGHILGQNTASPIAEVTVVRQGETQVVQLKLNKPLPSSFVQDSAHKSWMPAGGGAPINYSSMETPPNRTWWHGAEIESFDYIVRHSLQAETRGKYKAVYSFANLQDSPVYGGHVLYAFKSFGMVTKLTKGCSTPKTIPEGVIGFFESAKGRQWLHHPNNIQLCGARVEFNTFCTYLTEAFAKTTGAHPYTPQLHRALTDIVDLKVPVYEEDEQAYSYDLEGPHEVNPGRKNTSGELDGDTLMEMYGLGYAMLTRNGDAETLKKKSDFDIVKLWRGKKHSFATGSEGTTAKKRKGGDFDYRTMVKSRDADDADAGFSDAKNGPSSAPSSSGVRAHANASRPEQRPRDQERWPVPTVDEARAITERYERAGGHNRPLPQSTNVVIGSVTRKNKYFAYCRFHRAWMDWPPTSEKPRYAGPCACEAQRR